MARNVIHYIGAHQSVIEAWWNERHVVLVSDVYGYVPPQRPSARLPSADIISELAELGAKVTAGIVEDVVLARIATRGLGELVSGERVLMRRAIGILTDLQRLEPEVGSILDAFVEGSERAHVEELRLREAIALRNGRHGEASILHNAALRLAGELDALRVSERAADAKADPIHEDPGIPDPAPKIKG